MDYCRSYCRCYSGICPWVSAAAMARAGTIAGPAAGATVGCAFGFLQLQWQTQGAVARAPVGFPFGPLPLQETLLGLHWDLPLGLCSGTGKPKVPLQSYCRGSGGMSSWFLQLQWQVQGAIAELLPGLRWDLPLVSASAQPLHLSVRAGGRCIQECSAQTLRKHIRGCVPATRGHGIPDCRVSPPCILLTQNREPRLRVLLRV